MFADQKELAISFYNQTLFDYVDAIESYYDLWFSDRVPDTQTMAVNSARLKKSFDKIAMVVRIANIKFDTKLTLPIPCMNPQLAKGTQ